MAQTFTAQWNPQGVVTFDEGYTAGSKGRLKTTTVATIDGYVGQVLVDGVIAWESRPYRKAEKARRKADDHLSTRLRNLFA